MIDFVLGLLMGFPVGLVISFLYVRYSNMKKDFDYHITTIKEDIVNLHIKFDEILYPNRIFGGSL